jgi:trehalose/maltose transport system substrate-binding protein
MANAPNAGEWFSRQAHQAAVLAPCLLGLASASPAQGATLSLLCGVAASWPVEACRAASARFEAATGHEVQVIEAAAKPDETLDLLSKLFAVQSDAIDVVQLDIVWPGMLAPHLQDLGADGRKLAGEQVDAARSAGTVGSSVVALPLFVDVGALFYRRDLLEAYGESQPARWSDLRDSAARIVGAEAEAGRQLDGYLFQGRAYEGLTCNVLEWMATNGAAPLLDGGRINVNQPRLKALLTAAAGWIGEMAPRSSLEATEVETFARFAEGEAVFMRHWASSARRLEREVPDLAASTGVIPLPAAPKALRTGTLGGSMIGVSAYSSEPDAARALALHLASIEEQRARAIEGDLFPASRTLLDDSHLHQTLPGLAMVATSVGHAIVRPSKEVGASYIQLSGELSSTVHEILAGNVTADQGLDALQRRLERLSGGGRRW